MAEGMVRVGWLRRAPEPVIAAAANFVAATRTFPISAALTTRLDSVLPIEVVAPAARRRPRR